MFHGMETIRTRTFTLLTLVALSVVGGGCERSPIGEPRVVVENAAWTWFNDERAIFADGRLLVGSVDTTGHSGVAVLPLQGDGAPRPQGLGSFRERDDHNNPSLLQLDDGRILAAYAPHDTQPYWYWRHGRLVDDSVAWSAERRTDALGATATYANLFQLREEGGRVYDFFRGINFNPTYMASENGGTTWSEPHHFMAVGTGRTRPYVKYASDGRSRIDFVYTQAHPRREANDVYHIYYQGGWLHRSDGARIQPLPGDSAGPIPVAAGTKVYDADTAGRAWVWDLEYDADGAPVAVYITARDSTVGLDLRYRYARWDPAAGAWRDREIAYAGTRLYEGENHYAGGIVLDPADPSTVYASADVDPATGDATAHYQLYRGETADGGATWTWTALTPDATEDHIRPFVARGDGGWWALLWLRGTYTAYTDFATDIVGVVEERPEPGPAAAQ